jgi:two-component system cell cycle response regulator DivK
MKEKFALIVEDDPDLATIFSEAVKAAGFSTEVIRRGDRALERLHEIAPQVIVLDLHLPHVSGNDILKFVRGDDRLAKTRVIIATADARMAELLHEQADLVLLKPISFIQLRTLAERLGAISPS